MMTQEHLPVRIEGLDDYQTKVLTNSPAWLKTFRQRAVSQFIQLGIPTVKDEEYKYTTLIELTNKKFHLAQSHRLVEEDKLALYAQKGDINIVIVNGLISSEFSNLKGLPKGLTVSSFQEAATNFPTEIEATVNKLTANDTKSLLYLNHAMFLDGVFIKVADKAVIDPLIHIIHVTSGIEDNTVLFPRALIHVGTAAQASIMESHISFGPANYWSNAVTDMRIAADANVQYCKAEAEGAHAVHTGTTRVWQEKGSHFDSFNFAHGGRIVRNNFSILLKGEGTNTIMNGFYALDGQQHVDNHTLLDIQQPNCTSYQLYKGILNEQSRAVFNGKIYVHPEAQKTNGYQLNKHLLLGKEARIDTKPQLEIFADDVKCTHGATIGQLNEDEIFYLQSRCISKDLAVQLMSRGFIDEIINTIKSESVRRTLNHLLSVKFPAVKL
jgi:Fe-S cluster assembly protein SufD